MPLFASSEPSPDGLHEPAENESAGSCILRHRSDVRHRSTRFFPPLPNPPTETASFANRFAKPS